MICFSTTESYLEELAATEESSKTKTNEVGKDEGIGLQREQTKAKLK